MFYCSFIGLYRVLPSFFGHRISNSIHETLLDLIDVLMEFHKVVPGFTEFPLLVSLLLSYIKISYLYVTFANKWNQNL